MSDPLDGAGVHPEHQIGSGYVLETLIGSGAMGQVWRASSRQGDDVAIKLLHAELTRDPSFVARFLQEAQILTKVTGPGLVAVRDLVAESSRIAIVMDLIDGPDLRAELSRRGTFPAALAGEAILRILGGLATVHAAGIVHRDIKPENVLLAPAAAGIDPRISDFGIARIIEEGPAARTTVIGTPEYIAPEVADGGRPSPQSDLYAVGIMFYELLVGVTPFTGGSPLAVMRRHVEQQPGRPEGIPDPLWQFISWLLAKNPAERPESARTAAAVLEQIGPVLTGLPQLRKLDAPPAPSVNAQQTMLGTRTVVPQGVLAPESAAAGPRRHLVRNVLIAAAALLLIGGGAAAAVVIGGASPSAESGDVVAAEASPSASAPRTSRPTPTPTPTPTIDETLVPPVTGLLLARATTELRNAGLAVVITEIVDETKADGTVVSQVPEGGTEAPEDEKVTLTVSRRPVARYLADVSPVQGSVETGTQSLNGTQYVHTLYWENRCNWSDPEVNSVQYDLGRAYRQLRATAGAGDTSNNSGRVRLEAIADGRSVWSGDFSLGEATPIEVDLSGVLRLELRATTLTTEDCPRVYASFADAQIFGLPSEVPRVTSTIDPGN